MHIQQRLTGFAMVRATWIMWVLAGLSVGGIAVALDRAIYLIGTSETVRRLKVQIRGLLRSRETLVGPAIGILVALSCTCRFNVQ